MIINCRRAFVCGALISFSLLSGATGSSAQVMDRDRIPAKLTLEEALRLARTHNPAFLKASNDPEVAQADIKSAWGKFLPTLSTSMGVGGSQSHVETYNNPITQKPERLEDPQTSSGSYLSQGLSMGVTVFDGGANLRRLRVQRANARSVDAGVALQGRSLDAQIRRDFFSALQANQNIALNERLLANAQDWLRQTEMRFRTAATQQGDILGAKEDLATQELALARSRDDATKSRLALAKTIGISSDGSFEIEGALPQVFDPAKISVESMIALARSANPALQQQQLAVDIAKQNASISVASRWPSIYTSFSYGRSVSVPNYTAYKYLNPQNSSIGLSMSASLPLFTGFSKSADITRARVGISDADLELRRAGLDVENQVRVAYIDFQNAYKSLVLADLKVSLTDERLSLSQERYRSGSILFSELQTIMDRASSAQRGALDARFSWMSALIALELAVGAPVVQ